MSRKIMRVPLDFKWETDGPWEGYLMPDSLSGRACPACQHGYSPYAEDLFNQWYGHVFFDPRSTGSKPFTASSPGVRAFAERQCANSPGFSGSGESAIIREGERLAALFNGQWSHHLSQKDVDALIAAERLMDFTHDWNRETRRWEKKTPPVTPTAAQINQWSLNGFGHDSINASVVIRARCKRDSQPELCATCEGHGSVERYPGQRADAEAWEPTDPPTGEGWQLWETVSEGSPMTPVFPTADALIDHMVEHEGFRREAARTLVADGYTAGSFMVVGNTLLRSDKDADVIASLGKEN
jgi:hypothetical protein